MVPIPVYGLVPHGGGTHPQAVLAVQCAVDHHRFPRLRMGRGFDDLIEFALEMPVKANFEAFVYEAELINANLTSAINSLKMKIPNRVFHEWCNILIQCQSDRSMKNTLPTIAQKFSDVRVVQSELEAMMQGPRREAITMMFLVIANVPLLYFLNKDWFHTLIFTTPGKIALAICAAIILFALTQIMKLSKPIEYGGDGA